MRIHLPRGVGAWLLAVIGLLAGNRAGGGEPILPGYADYETYRAQVAAIGASKYATLKSLGTTLGRREVYLLSIGTERHDAKPAILVVGAVHPPHLLGSELAVRLARRLVEQAERDAAVRQWLQRVTIYVLPRPAPDACEAFFRRPHVERTRNERPVDDDHDGEVNEDGPDDLNGDGLITLMRVEDPTGPYMPHPDDPRVLVRADPQRDERGRYRVYSEGRDDDGDGQFNEDPPGGVAFNRNFTFRYPHYAPDAGPHAMSEVETRAVADFAFSHPNIAAVLTFTPEDNLTQPWKPDAAAEGQRIKTTVLSADVPYLGHVAEVYRQIHGGTNPPQSSPGQGSFSEWAYFHYGRWSFACRAWWIPKVEPGEKAAKREKPDKSGKSTPDHRGAEDLNALRWFAREKIDGFVPWRPVAHPDLPGRKVEVGGFKPFLRDNPPAAELEPLAEKHWRFLVRLVEWLPRVEIIEAKAEPLGGATWRITAAVANQGYLPTMPQMGKVNEEPHHLQIQVGLPRGCTLLTGSPRTKLPVLAGNGGRTEHTWLVRTGPVPPASLRVRAWSPSVGQASTSVKLEPPRTKP
jgi:hypothetical protein